ncbi:MAG: 1-acyl-sn-glycerol-3-phosphate acyltransferase [Bacteroidetes bacterium]|nr:MAG: 1-acyl-sn-glycerol-3-phosphate acyltransferase [Bacteroidota bacterium]
MWRFITRLGKKLQLFYLLTAIFAVTAYDAFKVIITMKLRRKKELFYKHARNWGEKLLSICRVNVEVIGTENILPGSAYIYVSNHSSLFDIPVLLAMIPDNIRIMYKRELEKIPFLGWALISSPFISINRSDPRDAMAGLEEAIKSVREDVSVVIFPEGTRSKDGTLGVFKRGAFVLASRSGKKIIPVSIVGTNKILPTKSFDFTHGHVKMIIGKPLSITQPIDRSEEKALINSVRSTIEQGMIMSD